MNYEYKDNSEQDVCLSDTLRERTTILIMFNSVPEHRMHVGI